MFKTNIIANKCLWLKTRPHFTLPLKRYLKYVIWDTFWAYHDPKISKQS